MQRSLRQIIGYSIGAVDGDIGRVSDFLFDDHTWTIRYLVAGTGKWLPGRKVLISPAGLRSADWLNSVLHVNRTRREIEESPPIEADKPVSRRKQEELSEYFAWPVYWAAASPAAGPGAAIPQPPVQRSSQEDQSAEGDPHLRSAREVTGYHVLTTDGEMGHIEDFIVDDETWTVRYLVVDTVSWWPGKKVILAPAWITGIHWDTKQVRFELSGAALKGAPEYDPSKPINREYEMVLYDYYGRPHYWETPESMACEP